MRTAELVAVLTAAGLDPTPREVAEAVWFARFAQPPADTQAPVAAPDPCDSGSDPQPSPDAADPAGTAPEPAGTPAAAIAANAGTTARGHHGRAPRPAWLPDVTGLQRALRPFKRRQPSRRRTELDEAATASFIARTGIWQPVLRPIRERWFDAAVVVDAAPAMALWQPLVEELRTILTQLGAFRDVRYWQLERAGITTARGGGSRDPGELIDPSGRRLFVVVTDGVDEPWHDGTAAACVARWAATGPVAIFQPMPERLWRRTGLSPRPGRFRASAPGLANSRLEFTDRRRSRAADGATPVPVLSIVPDWLAAWTRLVTAAATDGINLTATHVAAEPRPAADLTPVAAAPDEPASLLERFRATTSPEAYRLAVCLSITPLTVPVMRLVQQIAVPGSSPSILAELVLGGLLEQVGDDEYQFVAGVRHLLMDEIRRSESASVLGGVSAYFAERAGAPGGTFPVAALAPDGDTVRVHEDPLAWMPADVAARMFAARGLRRAEAPPAHVAHTRTWFLQCEVPQRVEVPGTFSLRVRITDELVEQVPMVPLPGFAPPPQGAAEVTIVVGTPSGVHTVDGAEHTLRVPMPSGSPPALSAVWADRAGVHQVEVAAWADGTLVGHLSVEVVAVPVADGSVAAAPLPSVTPSELPIVRIGLLGSGAAGKSTYLAALPVAAMQGRHGTWTIAGTDERSVDYLNSVVSRLAIERRFPAATRVAEPITWSLHGANPPNSLLRRFVRRQSTDTVEFMLDLIDTPGEMLSGSPDRDQLLEHLASAQGLIYLVDPSGTTSFRYLQDILVSLTQQLAAQDRLLEGRLPHYVAVCVTKFDNPEFFRLLVSSTDFVTQDKDGQQLPTVRPERAQEFFEWVCDRVLGPEGGLINEALRAYLHPDRIMYFATSSIGFRLNQDQVFDYRDFTNTASGGGALQIRDRPRPINVLEPLISLEARIRDSRPRPV